MQHRTIVATSVAAAVLAVGGAIAGFTVGRSSSSSTNGATVKTATAHVDGNNEIDPGNVQRAAAVLLPAGHADPVAGVRPAGQPLAAAHRKLAEVGRSGRVS